MKVKLLKLRSTLLAAAALSLLASAGIADESKAKAPAADAAKAAPAPDGVFTPEAVTTEGSVTVEGQRIDYRAVTGTLVVHPKDWDDAPQKPTVASPGGDAARPAEGAEPHPHNPTAEAAMSYVAYFKKGVAPTARPVMFFYNGGPGSSTVWLHMGAFGPHRVVTLDDSHAPAAPYELVNNDYSLLDSGDGRKLERYGAWTVVRPEPQCLWRAGRPSEAWAAADAVFTCDVGLPTVWAARYLTTNGKRRLLRLIALDKR